MITGAKNWNDKSIRYDQENNIIETFLTKLKAQGQSTFRLESCGVEATACAIEAVDGRWNGDRPSFMGWGDIMFDYLNSYKSAGDIPIDDPEIPNNEFMENLAFAGSVFSNCKLNIEEYESSFSIDFSLKSMLKNGAAVVLSYRTDYGSGHYITVVCWDDEKRVFKVYDPWSKNQHCKNGGVLEEYPDTFFIDRARPRLMEVWK